MRKGQKVTTVKVKAAVKDAGSQRAAARLLGVDPATVRAHLNKIADVPDAETSARPIEQLLEDRNAEFKRTERQEVQRNLVQIKIKQDGPLGLVHCGDPHLDDPGTDIKQIEEHCRIIRETDGMVAGNVGDYTNNWIGRLARLYSGQTTTEEEGWLLVEWYLNQCPWLYLVGGNHDAWSGAGNPLRWIAKQVGAHLQYWGVRMNLKFPNKRQVRVNARHDFRGHSQWNEAHGVSKAARIGWRDHILVAGHKHVNGYQILRHPDPEQDVISHAIRVASYEIYGRYAAQIGADGNPISAAVTTIIDPYAKRETALVQVFHDIEAAADYLTFLRKRYNRQGVKPRGKAKSK